MLKFPTYIAGAFSYIDVRKEGGFTPSPRPRPSRVETTGLDGRATEWVITGVLLGFSILLALPGNTLARTNLVVLEAWGFPDQCIAIIYGTCGLLRLWALYINGRRTGLTARIRVFTAILSAILWMNLTAIVYYVVLTNGGVATIGMVTWPAFAAMDFISVARAWRDAKYHTT